MAGKQRGKEDDRYLWPEMFRVIQETKPTWVIGENVANFVNMGLDDCVLDLESEGYEVQPLIIPACSVNAPHRRDRVWIISYAGGKQTDQQLLRPREFGGQPRQSLATGEKAARQANGAPSNNNAARFCEVLANAQSGTRNVGASQETREYPEERCREIGRCYSFTDATHSQRRRLQSRLQQCARQTAELVAQDRWSYRGYQPWGNWEVEPRVGRLANGLPSGVVRDRLRALGNAIVPQVAYPIFQGIVDIKRQLREG